MKVKRLTAVALLSAAAMVLSYAEGLIPFGIPGVKPGLANAIVLLVLYTHGTGEALAVSCLRVLCASLLGGFSTLPYSLVGAALSFGGMLAAKTTGKLPVTAVSVIGAALHSIGQVCVAAVIFSSPLLFVTYLPLIGLISVLCGVLTGVCTQSVLRILRNKH